MVSGRTAQAHQPPTANAGGNQTSRPTRRLNEPHRRQRTALHRRLCGARRPRRWRAGPPPYTRRALWSSVSRRRFLSRGVGACVAGPDDRQQAAGDGHHDDGRSDGKAAGSYSARSPASASACRTVTRARRPGSVAGRPGRRRGHRGEEDVGARGCGRGPHGGGIALQTTHRLTDSPHGTRSEGCPVLLGPPIGARRRSGGGRDRRRRSLRYRQTDRMRRNAPAGFGDLLVSVVFAGGRTSTLATSILIRTTKKRFCPRSLERRPESLASWAQLRQTRR